MHIKLNVKNLDKTIDLALMESLCKQYVSSLKNIKRKARTHALNINKDEDLLFVSIFAASFDALELNEQKFINDTYFFQHKEKDNDLNKYCVNKFLNIMRNSYEYI